MTDPIQQQLIAARKNQILDAAVIVFAEKGFHSTTIRDIARQAGISDGTIYNYFDNKTALLLAIFERMRESVLQGGLPAAPEAMDFRGFIKTFLAQPLSALGADDFALFRVIMSEMMVNAELRQLYYERILEPTLAVGDSYFQAQAAQHGIVISEEDARLTLRVLSSTVMGLMIAYLLGDESLTSRWQELPDFIADLVLNGLKTTS